MPLVKGHASGKEGNKVEKVPAAAQGSIHTAPIGTLQEQAAAEMERQLADLQELRAQKRAKVEEAEEQTSE